MNKILLLLLLICFKHSSSQIFNYAWNHHMGGVNYQFYQKMIVMDNNDIVINGSFTTYGDIDPSFQTNNYLYAEHGKTFIQRITPQGELLWVAQFDSNSTLGINDMNRDAAGDIYICGSFTGAPDMDPSSDTLILRVTGSGSSYFAKYSGQDGHLIWARSMNNLGDLRCICADASGNIFMTGNFTSTFDFDPGPNVFTLPIPSISATGCVAQYDPQGNFVNAFYYGIQYFETIARDIEVDSHDRVYFMGSFESVIDFDPGPDTFNLTGSNHDAFLIKYTNTLQFLDGVAFLGTSGFSSGKILFEPNGDLLIGGEVTGGNMDFDGSADTASLIFPGPDDIYFTRQDSMLQYISAWQITGDGLVRGYDTDTNGDIFVLIKFTGTIDVDPGPGVVNLSSNGDETAIARYSSSGQYLWSISMNGGDDDPRGIAVVGNTKLLYTSYFDSYLDVDPGPDTILIRVIPNGGTDSYIAAYDLCNPPVTHLSPVICKGQTFAVGSQTFSETGNFKVRLPSASGCDSIINVDLTVVSPITEICPDYHTLICHTDSASFQWINCSASGIVGSGSSFQVPNNDEYAVIVTQNGCVDTSNCLRVYQSANEEEPEFAWGHVLPIYLNSMQVSSNKGNIYIAGVAPDTSNVELLGGTGHYLSGIGFPNTACIVKYDENRNYLWGIEFGWPAFGGSGGSVGSIILDDEENIYALGGYSDSIEVDPGPGSVYLGTGGYNQALFLMKFNPSGQLQWADQIPYNSTSTNFNTIFLDDSGHVYLGGTIDGIVKVHPLSGDSDLFMSGTYSDLMLIQFATSNGQPIWHNISPGPVNVMASVTGGSVDHSGNIIVTGYFEYDIDFDFGPGTSILSPWSAGYPDCFIVKYSPSMQYIWAKRVNSYTGRDIHNVVVDCDDNVYVSGPAPFLYKYNSSGTLIKVFPVSGNGLHPRSMAIDELNNLYAYYALNDPGGIIGTDTFISTSSMSNVHDLVIAKFRSDGHYDWGMQLSSDGDDRPANIQTGKNGDIYFSGYAGDTLDADISSNTYNLDTWYFNNPNFLIKYGQTCAPIDTSVTGDSLYLRAMDTSSCYQWIDCSSGAIIPGATSIVAPQTYYGYLRVIVYQGECADTSGCHFSASTLDILERGNMIISAFPNPASNAITISFTPLSQQSRIIVINPEGKEMLRDHIMPWDTDYQVHTDDFPPGLYTVVLTDNDRSSSIRFLVE